MVLRLCAVGFFRRGGFGGEMGYTGWSTGLCRHNHSTVGIINDQAKRLEAVRNGGFGTVGVCNTAACFV